MPTEYITFRGKPILKIVSNDDERIKIQFDQKKARLLIANIDEIIKFANDGKVTAESKEGSEVVS